MANTVKLKRSAVPSKAPLTTDLQLGELAVNTYDGKLFLKKDNGTESIVEIGGGGGSGTVTSVAVSGGTTGLTTSGGPITNSGTITVAGTLAVSNGGTGATDAATALSNLGGVAKAGDTMSGALTLSGAPTVDLHAATKAYVDARDGDVQGWANTQFVSLAGSTMSGALVMSDQQVSRAVMKDGAVAYHNSGTTNALDYVNGSHQRWAPNTGAQTLSISNWPPTGNLGELLIEGVNLGAATITWPTINWIKSDGTTTTTFASNGVTLQTSGIDWVLLWTRDAGSTIYGKIVR